MNYIEILPPDPVYLINVDQITRIHSHNEGCAIILSDGSEHIFHNTTYAEMKKKLNL